MNNWLWAALGSFLLWGTYSIFGNKATAIHGEKVSMVFESVAVLLLGLLALSTAAGDFARVTPRSFAYASIMGVMSAGGFYLALLAMRLAPTRIAAITMITGLYPVLTVLTVTIVLWTIPSWLPEATRLTSRQLLGASVALTGLVVMSWDSAWTPKLKHAIDVLVPNRF